MTVLVMIHGLLGSLDYFPRTSALSGARILTPPLMGYGSQTVPASVDRLSLAGQARSIIADLHAKGIRRWKVLGHSVGGAIAFLMARQAPDCVEAVVSAEGNFTLNDAFWSRKIATLDPGRWAAEYDNIVTNPSRWLSKSGVSPTSSRIEWAKMILAFQSAQTVWEMAQATVHETGNPQFVSDIEELVENGLRVHLISGERSGEAWDVPHLVRKRAVSQQLIPGVGHMMMLEQPEAFCAAVALAIRSDAGSN